MPPRLSDELEIPVVPWALIRTRLQRFWNAREAPHHSVIGQTRSGKSYLTRHGILDVCQNDRVLFIDCKGDDATLDGLGHVVDRMPSKALMRQREFLKDNRRPKPRRHWYRLVTDPDWDVAREQVREALESVFSQGDWVIVVDEARYITDAREPGLGLRGLWEQITLRGGSRGLAMVTLTQEPRWVPGSFYTQSAFYWFSRVEDEAAQKRISEVGSSRALIDFLRRIPRRWWVYMDNLEDERFWALTSVPARGNGGRLASGQGVGNDRSPARSTGDRSPTP